MSGSTLIRIVVSPKERLILFIGRYQSLVDKSSESTPQIIHVGFGSIYSMY